MNDAVHDPIAVALAEDVGAGDVTSDTFIPPDLHGSARIVSRENAVIAGTQTAAEVFRRVDASLHVDVLIPDGSRVGRGDAILDVRGSVRSILTAERVALNFLQRLSGIATLTRRFVDATAGTPARILDTRKTTPGLRALEKAAVVAGGGVNHRFGLFDMVMLKDNHLAANPDFAQLATRIAELRKAKPGLRIEAEADTLDQVRELLRIDGIDVILLDNMTPELLRHAVAMRGDRAVKYEASGGVTLDTVAHIAATGVDFISVGAITHSARAIDLSLELTHGVR